ncbi:MAG TPA: NAD(P)/FAD-dependent oxidoreductase [Steroidobacteraceae bacterium]|nr:NAD(P)/FAD-dependent oxidoreductase [Steroidobacteraceae bacterium]
MRSATVNIAGGGLAGALLAVLLARRGRPVRLIERRPDPRSHAADSGRSINLALAARGIRALEHAGLMDRIRPLMLPMRGRMIHEPGATAAPRLLPYGQRAEEVIHSVGRAALNRVLIEAAAGYAGVELCFDTTCTAVDATRGSLTVRDNRTGASRVFDDAATIGADGAGSAIRSSLAHAGRLLATELPLEHGYKELLIPARDGNFQLEPDALHVWPRHGYMLIALPNPDRSFTATLFLPQSGAPGFDTLTAEQAVRDFFDSEFPDAAALIPDLPAQFRAHPQGHLGTIRTQPWACGRVLLLGDAAHAIVPFHGQGMNAAFEDCAVLDSMLPSGEACDLPRLFAAFYEARRRDAEAIAQMALENYAEMRSAVLDERFLRRKAWALQLERRHPAKFIPRYAMVMFHPEIPYSEALRRGGVQQRILDTFDAGATGETLGAAQLSAADELIHARL